jgi:hypothetical protein
MTEHAEHKTVRNVEADLSATLRESTMPTALTTKLMTMAAAAAFVLATAASGQAENWKSHNSPGHKMQRYGSVPGHPGASGYAPGHLKKRHGYRYGYRYHRRETTGSGWVRIR